MINSYVPSRDLMSRDWTNGIRHVHVVYLINVIVKYVCPFPCTGISADDRFQKSMSLDLYSLSSFLSLWLYQSPHSVIYDNDSRFPISWCCTHVFSRYFDINLNLSKGVRASRDTRLVFISLIHAHTCHRNKPTAIHHTTHNT